MVMGKWLADVWRIVLSNIISQLRPGADLSRVVLPTFILEPRSMLERITKCVHDVFSCWARGVEWERLLMGS